MNAPPWAAQEPWVAILVMILSVGFWIVSTLFKTLMEPPKQVRPGPGGPPGGLVPSPRTPLSLEEFLQEARRRRSESEPNQSVLLSPVSQTPTKSKDRAGETGKRRKNRKPTQASPESQRVPLAEIVNPEAQVPQALIVPEPIDMATAPRQEAVGKPVEEHPLRGFMRAALSSPQGIRGSLVLGEALGQPRCRRPYGPASHHRPG